MSLAVFIVVAACALKLCASTFLECLNLKSLRDHAGAVPEAFSSFMDAQTYAKSGEYTRQKTKFCIAEDSFSFVFLTALLVSGAFPYMYGKGLEMLGSGVWGQALTLVGIFAVISIPSLPFEFFEQFSIEQRFGFNKSTVGLWVSDKIKGFVIGVVLFTPILALILYFTSKFSSTWWLWGFVAVALFQTLMIVIYPMFIIPLFNKLEDLPDGELKTALFDLAKRGGFFAKTIQVIDGSRRSAHSNAYFTGFGKFRRIVLFDTLIDQLQQSELEAVLAHEIGHYRKGHIVKMIVVSYVMTFVMFAFLGYLADCRWFYEQFGFSQGQGIGSVLLIFALFSGAFTFWFAPVSNYFSRKREYEADTFAAELCGGGQPLISALKKLHKKNLGNLTPHPLYSAFHYSHPTLLERMDNLYR